MPGTRSGASPEMAGGIPVLGPLLDVAAVDPGYHGRLAEGQEWGRRPLWTHFDGYQVRKKGALEARR